MKHSRSGVIVVLAIVAVVEAKGNTTEIVVSGSHVMRPIELRDRDVLAPFNVWSGPGTRQNGVEGMDGFIIDWRSGAVEPPLTRLQQFEIAFYSDAPRSLDDAIYVVSYGIDPSNGDGFVYLPGRGDPRWSRNVQSIHRGPRYEGHWFHASAAWQDVMQTHVLGPSAASRKP